MQSSPLSIHSSPVKPVDSAYYLKKKYSDMDRIDRRLEVVAKEKATIPRVDDDHHKNSDSSVLDNVGKRENSSVHLQERDLQIKKIEDMIMDLNCQSEELQKMFR